MAENWIETDEVDDVAGSIRHVLRTARYVSQDPLAWKWVAMALHSALQGSCICHLTTSAPPLGAVTARNARDWTTYFEASRTNPNAKPPKTHLMSFPDLLKAARKPNSAGDRSNLNGITISESELCWLRRFHDDVRNQFVHFEPMSWSIEVSGFPQIASLISRIIGEIVQIGWAFRHQDVAAREEMQQSLLNLADIESFAWREAPASSGACFV